MIYEITHYVQEKMPWAWNLVEWGNAEVFALQHRKGLKRISAVLEKYTDKFHIVEATLGDDIPALVKFFAEQPEEAFKFFKPHEFDDKTLRKLVKRKSFLMFLVKDREEIVGYFFLRCFFIGKAFLGKMVDKDMQGKGIGKKMCSCAMDVATMLGLRMFETISKENLASLNSTQKVLDTKIIEEMDNGYLYIEDLQKNPNRGGYKWLIGSVLYHNLSMGCRRSYSYAA